MPNMCSYTHAQESTYQPNHNDSRDNTSDNHSHTRNDSNMLNNDLFSVNGDRLELFGISINIDDLIILIMLFFMFRENQIDYSIIIILALILFDQG